MFCCRLQHAFEEEKKWRGALSGQDKHLVRRRVFFFNGCFCFNSTINNTQLLKLLFGGVAFLYLLYHFQFEGLTLVDAKWQRRQSCIFNAMVHRRTSCMYDLTFHHEILNIMKMYMFYLRYCSGWVIFQLRGWNTDGLLPCCKSCFVEEQTVVQEVVVPLS